MPMPAVNGSSEFSTHKLQNESNTTGHKFFTPSGAQLLNKDLFPLMECCLLLPFSQLFGISGLVSQTDQDSSTPV